MKTTRKTNPVSNVRHRLKRLLARSDKVAEFIGRTAIPPVERVHAAEAVSLMLRGENNARIGRMLGVHPAKIHGWMEEFENYARRWVREQAEEGQPGRRNA